MAEGAPPERGSPLADITARQAEAMRYLQFVGLHKRAHDPAGEVPHGQQRLVEIARALVGRPSLLLLDEPAAGLSLDELDGLARLVHEIASLGTTVVLGEHHLELVANLARSVTVKTSRRPAVMRGAGSAGAVPSSTMSSCGPTVVSDRPPPANRT